MTHGSHSVRRLHVTAAAPLASRVGFAARMEDALRTSSPPAEWKGRLVLIRRLRMRAGEKWPAHLLARTVEATWRADPAPVPAAHASARAQAVWFADEASARLALIERLAAGKDVSAWFWQRWLAPGADVVRQIAQLLVAPGAMLAVEERFRYFADACRAIADPGLIDRVIPCCDGAQLRWLLPESLPRIMRTAGQGSEGHAESQAGGPSEPPRSDPTDSDEAELREIAKQLARAALGSRSVSLPLDLAVGSHAIDLRTDKSAQEGEGAATEWAGLFFALNLFGHVGRSDAGWLRDIAAFVRVAADDPLLAVLDRLELRGGEPEGESNEIRPAPLRELRFACLRATRRPLRRVLRRAGCIHLTRTHLTIALRLAEVSLPVRIAGLDIDPGWVASLGRVVRFEYD
jgi:hypothetical protein